MTLPTKPTGHIDWVPDEDSDYVTEPAPAKKLTGWGAEQPTAKNFNWMFARVGNWQKYFEEMTDILSQGIFNAIVGAAGSHATLALAMADAQSGWRILVIDNYTIDTTIVINVANVEIHFAPHVVYSKGVATKGLSITNERIKIYNGRFAGFTVSGDIAVAFDSGGNYGFIEGSYFAAGTDTEVDDDNVTAGKKPYINTQTEI